jgi:hypothetical protein
MPLGIEQLPNHLEGFDSAALERVMQLPTDQLDAVTQYGHALSGGPSFNGRRQRAFEIVDDRQELANHVGRDVLGEIAAFAVRALPIVVEFGRRAEEAVAEFVAFACERVFDSARIAGRQRNVFTGHGVSY